MYPAYIGAGVAGVGLLGTILFAAFKADAQSKADSVARQIREAAGTRATGICTSTNDVDVKRFGGPCTTLKQNNDKVDTNATIANVSVAVLAVGATFTAVWLIVVPIVNARREHTAATITKPTITPYAGYNNGGLVLSGSF